MGAVWTSLEEDLRTSQLVGGLNAEPIELSLSGAVSGTAGVCDFLTSDNFISSVDISDEEAFVKPLDNCFVVPKDKNKTSKLSRSKLVKK
jgi:hypothetical protein